MVMAISLPERTMTAVRSLTPREIVAELDKYVIGQAKAKRAVAIALRNRLRRQRLPNEMAEEVTPKNILMIGPTGVGKTEIARRLARLAHSPFIKVEASKFTEVGYVGRDVESMVRDLVELAVDMVRAEKGDEVKDKAEAAAEERLLDLLLPPVRPPMPGEDPSGRDQTGTGTRERMREQLRSGRLDERVVELDMQTPSMPSFEIIAGSSVEEIGSNLKDMVGNMFGGRAKTRRLKVPQALEQLTAEEQSKLLDMETVSKTAVQRVEQAGIIFVDEIDKIASRDGAGGGHGPDVSREGVQRDILPIVEGTTVNTKHGMVTEPRNALVKQYIALLGTEDLDVTFTPDAVERIADFAARVNDTTENIGARRLHTVMERLLDELSFDAPDRADKSVTIDEAYVDRMLADIVRNEDLSRYIL
jgi:ATP-dependent HslUV protease ATP-binding subunit HslU